MCLISKMGWGEKKGRHVKDKGFQKLVKGLLGGGGGSKSGRGSEKIFTLTFKNCGFRGK